MNTRWKGHYSRLITVLVILIFTMVGCSKQKDKPVIQNSQVPTNTITPSSTPEVTATPTPTMKPVIYGESVNEEQTVFAIEKAFYKDGLSFESAFFYDDQRLLIVQKDENSKTYLSIYNIYSGKIEKETQLEYELYIDTCTIGENGTIVLQTSWTNSFVYLTKSLTTILTAKEFKGEFSSIAPSQSGDKFYYIDPELQNIYQYDITNKQSTLLMALDTKQEKIQLNMEILDGKYITANYYGKDGTYGTLLIEPGKKNVISLDGLSAPVNVSNNYLYLNDYDRTSKGYFELLHVDKPRVIHKFYFSAKEEGNTFTVDGVAMKLLSVLNVSGEELSGESDVLAYLNAYSLSSMELERRASIQASKVYEYLGITNSEEEEGTPSFIGTNGMGISKDQKIGLFTYYIAGETRLLLWDMTKEEEVVTEEEQSFYFSNEEYSEQENDALAARIKDEYGVTVYIRDKVVRFFPDFAVNALFDEKTTNDALVEVEKLLSKFPKGFFKELNYGEIQGLEIYLCGHLVQGSEQGVENPGGFALQYKNKQMIVLDATFPSNLATTLSHEIMHAIDSRLEYQIYTKDAYPESVLEKWYKLNPKKYDYKWGYVDDDGVEYDAFNNSKYTPMDEDSYDNVNNIYFIDYYANTFPIEDRARIFEALMTADTELPYAFKSKNLTKKAKYLCKMIRMAMDTIEDDSEEVYYWERLLMQ